MDWINFLPNGKILDLPKFKAFKEDKLNMTEKLKFAMGRVENVAENGENVGNQHYLLFPECFQKPFFQGH